MSDDNGLLTPLDMHMADAPKIEHGRDSAHKGWLRRRRMIWPEDWLTIAVYAVGLAIILRWLP